jgi:hypothetical protein
MLSTKIMRLLTGLVAELLGHGQARERDAETRAGGLVHLAEDHGDLVEHVGGCCRRRRCTRPRHFAPEVVALAGAFADAAEHGVAAELTRDTGDHFLDDDGLADAGTAEEADLAASDEGAEQVDDLDAGGEDLGLGVEVAELGRLAVDRAAVDALGGGLVVDRLAEQVEDAAEDLLADGDGDGTAGVGIGMPRFRPSVEPSATARTRRRRGAAGPHR